MNENINNVDDKKNKKVKKVGPIRFGALFFIVGFITIIVGYYILFFDYHVRMVLEKVGTGINGAEVNVDSVHTYFKAGRMEIKRIQFTDPENLTLNKFEVAKVTFDFSWDALLRAKILINEMSADEIRVGSKRERPGKKVIIPKEEIANNAGPSAAEIAMKKIKSEGEKFVGEKFKGNVFGDLANFSKSGEFDLSAIGDDLASKKKFDLLKGSYVEKKALWEERFKKLPTPNDFKTYEERIKKIDVGNLKNPDEIKAALKEVKEITSELNTKVKVVKESGDSLTKEVDGFQKTFAQIDDWVKEDIEDLKKKFKLPEIDPKNLGEEIFRKYVFSDYDKYLGYYYKVKPYLPPKKDKSKQVEKNISEEAKLKRSFGKVYHFGHPKSYPLFWLQEGRISSRTTDAMVEGEIKNISSNPELTQKMMELNLSGSMPSKKIEDFKFSLKLDFINTFAQYVDLAINRYKVTDLMLVKDDLVTFGMDNCDGNLIVKGALSEGVLAFSFQNRFSDIVYITDSKNKIINDVLTNVVGDIRNVTVNGSVDGNLTDPRFSLKSNMGDAFSASIKKYIEKKKEELELKLKTLVQDRLKAEKEKLINDHLKNGEFFKKRIAELTGGSGKLEDLLKNKEKDILKQEANKLKDNAKDGAKKLLKKFKI